MAGVAEISIGLCTLPKTVVALTTVSFYAILYSYPRHTTLLLLPWHDFLLESHVKVFITNNLSRHFGIIMSATAGCLERRVTRHVKSCRFFAQPQGLTSSNQL